MSDLLFFTVTVQELINIEFSKKDLLAPFLNITIIRSMILEIKMDLR